MSLMDYTPPAMAVPQNVPNGQQVRDEDRRQVTFLMHSMQNGTKSREMGYPVFESVPHIKIEQMGERDYIMRPATEADARAFPTHWAAFKEQRSQIPEGAPLSFIFPDDPGPIDTLRFFKIHTVEQLAALSDTAMSNVGMGAQLWKQRAQAWLDQASKGSGTAEQARQIEALQRKLDLATTANDKLLERLEVLEKRSEQAVETAPRRRGA